MREPRYSILSDINDGIDRAKQGKLALYWQRNIEHEYRCKKVTPAEQQAYTDLQDILAAVPQWSDEEELRSGMEGIGGRVWFCYFWEEHNSMVQLTEDCSGKLRLLTFWIRMSPQRCERRLHCTHNSSLLNVCRSGMFRL